VGRLQVELPGSLDCDMWRIRSPTFYLIDILVRDYDVREPIFDHDHQFQAVEQSAPRSSLK
jgi:hypothetical protein